MVMIKSLDINGNVIGEYEFDNRKANMDVVNFLQDSEHKLVISTDYVGSVGSMIFASKQ